MRSSILLIITLLILSAATAQAGTHSVPWNERHPTDKILHFVWGAGTQATLSIGASALDMQYASEIGLAGAIATGIAKECVDKNFDPFDFAATAGGGLVSYLADKYIRSTYFPALQSVQIEPTRGGAMISYAGTF